LTVFYEISTNLETAGNPDSHPASINQRQKPYIAPVPLLDQIQLMLHRWLQSTNGTRNQS